MYVWDVRVVPSTLGIDEHRGPGPVQSSNNSPRAGHLLPIRRAMLE
nr:hypothetical protein Q903MT_gene5308 [Picea sitchensis]